MPARRAITVTPVRTSSERIEPGGQRIEQPLQPSQESAALTGRLRALHLPVACCALEALAATSALAALGVDLVDDEPAEADLLVISGTVTHTMAPTIAAVHARLRPGARVIAFGVCATTGGPYWDSYSVLQGVDRVVPVDRYVPGCPPRPQALVDAITSLIGAQG